MRLSPFVTVLLGITAATATPAQHMSPDGPNQLPSSKPTAVVSYGDDPLQFGELRLPDGDGPFPVVVVIHGGCWTAGFATLKHTAAAATALTTQGVATWNIEYRQVGDAGSGWPGTFTDWGKGTDYLRTLAESYPLDLRNVVVTGHSAGAHAALFVASRPALPADSEIRGRDPLPVSAAVAIDGPGNLADFIGLDADICGKPVIEPLMGGSPEDVGDRYMQGSPSNNLPLGTRIALVSASPVLPPAMAEAFRVRASEAGDTVDVHVIGDSGHFEPVAPGTPQWRRVEAQILEYAGVQPGR